MKSFVFAFIFNSKVIGVRTVRNIVMIYYNSSNSQLYGSHFIPTNQLVDISQCIIIMI